MFFSIIIPVYNVEDYLVRAVDSVLGQGYSGDFEIILVDDGSTDKSGLTCDDYARKGANIRVIHKKNGGLSSARNAGMEIATGEYIVFLDSDDWLDVDALAAFHSILGKHPVDILGFSYKERDESGAILNTVVLEYATTAPVRVADLLPAHYLLPSAWQYVYRGEFIERNKLRFMEGIYHEDVEFVARMLCHAETGFFLNYYGYNYFHRAGSIMFNKDKKHLKKRLVDSGIIVESFEKFLVGLTSSPVKSAYIRNQIRIVNYRIFLNLLNPVFEFRWVFNIYKKMKTQGYIPLNPTKGERMYPFYRVLTLLRFPFLGLRVLYRLIVATSGLRAKLRGVTR
jgi:glycosyltransferase involved in cell wall biosynthesis